MAGKKQKQSYTKNPLESVKELGSDFNEAIKANLSSGTADLFSQLIDYSLPGSKKESNKTNSDGSIDIFNASKQTQTHEEESKPEMRIEAAINYHGEIVRGSERSLKQMNNEVNRKVDEILKELKDLVASSKELEVEFAEVAITLDETQKGTYHVNFFEWMLIVIKQARQNVEDSGNWLNALKSKKGAKSYWNMFKKHGTTFGLSGERAVATQVG